MHILKIIHGYPPFYNAGSEVYSQAICDCLSQNHRVTVLTREENENRPDFELRTQEVNPKLKLLILNVARAKDGYRHPQLDDLLGSILRDSQPDVAHIGHLNHLSTGFMEVLKTNDIPVLYTLHDFWLLCPRGQFLQRNFDGTNLHCLCEKQENQKCATVCYQSFFSGLKNQQAQETAYWTQWIQERMNECRNILEKTALFIAPSQYLRNRFIEEGNIPAEKIVYLDYGFPLHYLRPKPSRQNAIFTFGYIGTHIPAKGVNLLIEAFLQLKGQARLQIWGRSNGQLTQQLQRLAVTDDRIHFEGEYVNSNLAQTVFSQVDCIVVPSIWAENSPLVIHEAQACQVPVITADFGGMKEYVRHLENGLLFQHRDAVSLLEQLNFALTYPQKIRDLGEKKYLFTPDESVPSIKEHCNRLLTLYQQVIQQNKKH